MGGLFRQTSQAKIVDAVKNLTRNMIMALVRRATGSMLQKCSGLALIACNVPPTYLRDLFNLIPS